MTDHELENILLELLQPARSSDMPRRVELCEQALSLVQREQNASLWAELQNRLGNSLTQSLQNDRAENIERAIDAYQQALRVRTRDAMPIEWAQTMNNLANAYRNRIRGDQADNIEHAIAAYHQALQVLTRETMPAEWAQVTNNLAIIYYSRIKGDRAHNIEQAIAAYQQALEVRTREAMPVEWATTMMNLAIAYTDRLQGDQTENMRYAINAYQQALEVFSPELLPDERCRTARNLGHLYFEEHRWIEAIDLYQLALHAAENLYQASLLSSEREAKVETAGLYSHIAYALARIGRLPEAVITLEQGQVRVLEKDLSLDRARLEWVQVEDPEAYGLFLQATTRIYDLEVEARVGGLTSSRSNTEDLHKQAREAWEDLNAAIARIRRLPGYENFLAELDWDDVIDSVKLGLPLVYLVTTPSGSLALIVHSNGVEPIWLDMFTEYDLERLLFGVTRRELIRRFTGGRLNASEIGGWFGAYHRRQEQFQDCLETLEQTTHQLWEELIGPVVDYLRGIDVQRAALVPTGLLALLPLHAAWTEQDGQRQYASDQVAFSYAQSARILSRAQRVAPEIKSTERLLTVGEAHPVTQGEPLPNSNTEVSAIAALFGAPQFLQYEQATRSAVLETLPHVQVAHFSCHSINQWTDPLQSGLLMANDEKLTVQDLFQCHLDTARLATLSVCEAGIVDVQLPDEVVTLTSAFIQAGFAGVVASLWLVPELSTAMLMERFYRLWREEGLSPIVALCEAQRWLRDTTNSEKVEYFKQGGPSISRMKIPEHIAAEFLNYVASRQPDDRDFEHPFWWAGFCLTGI